MRLVRFHRRAQFNLYYLIGEACHSCALIYFAHVGAVDLLMVELDLETQVDIRRDVHFYTVDRENEKSAFVQFFRWDKKAWVYLFKFQRVLLLVFFELGHCSEVVLRAAAVEFAYPWRVVVSDWEEWVGLDELLSGVGVELGFVVGVAAFWFGLLRCKR